MGKGDDNVVSITAGGRTVRTTSDRIGSDPAVRRIVEAGVKAALGDEEPEGYMLAEGVGAVAQEVIDSDPRFAHINGLRVGWALLWGKQPEGKGGIHLLARAVKAPALWAQLGEYDVVVWANEMAWRRLSSAGRHALLAHELCHIGLTDKGTVTLLDHDIEEFAWVARRYGQWHSGLEYFAEQMGLGLAEPKGGEG